MGGGERPDAHAGELDLVGPPDELERQLRQVAPRGNGARGGKEPTLKAVAEHREAPDVVGVLMREHHRNGPLHVHAKLSRAGEKRAPRDAAVHQHEPARPLHHGGVALRAAGKDVQVYLGRHGAPLAVVHFPKAARRQVQGSRWRWA